MPGNLAPNSIGEITSGITLPRVFSSVQCPSPGSTCALVSEIAAVPFREKADMQALQAADPHIAAFLQYWRRGVASNCYERAKQPREVLELVHQWKRVRQRDGFLYREVFLPPGKVRVFQVLLKHLASRPLEILAIDFTLLERASNGCENVLVITDVFSKFTQAYPMRD